MGRNTSIGKSEEKPITKEEIRGKENKSNRSTVTRIEKK
jgi:hypothetical protein